MEFCSMLYGSLDGRGTSGCMSVCVRIYICTAESLHCSPETIINNIINWLYPVQNEKFEIKNKK